MHYIQPYFSAPQTDTADRDAEDVDESKGRLTADVGRRQRAEQAHVGGIQTAAHKGKGNMFP